MSPLKLPPPPVGTGVMVSSGVQSGFLNGLGTSVEGVSGRDNGFGSQSAAVAGQVSSELAQWLQQVQTTVNNLGALSVYYKYVPSGSGFSTQVPANTGLLLIANTSVLAAGNAVLPVKAFDGMRVDIVSMAGVTSATVTVQSGLGMTILGTAVTTFAAGVTYRYVYDASANAWDRIQ